uniref:DDT domain-containing protein n=1 Tax=Leersia perrieri TaxID=77586 RepID=A0A0D9W0A2_9ORYZ
MAAAAAATPPRGRRQQQQPEEAEVVVLTPRRTRLPRACNSRPKVLPPPPPPPRPRPPPPREAKGEGEDEEEEEVDTTPRCRVVTPLVSEPSSPAEMPRWRLRGMWELASVINFLHVFRPLLNIEADFTAEELEDAILLSNNKLADIHMPLLKSIPPVNRVGMGRGTWITILCRKLKYWWNWVAEGDLPVVASHGTEIEMYKELEPATRLLILKVICDIRVEQEDIRNFIDSSLKRGHELPVFRKERIGGDSYGISYWYDEDPVLGHRLYREIRKVEYVNEPTKKARRKGVSSLPVVSYQWETVACNFDEFEVAAEKLFSSRNRTEASLGKKLKNNYLPEIEKIHKKKERLVKKQQREALLLDNHLTVDGFTSVRSRRERKRVTYTFDDYERSINEAIKTTKKGENSSDIAATNRRVHPKREASTNGRLAGPSPLCNGFYGEYPLRSHSYQGSDGEKKPETLDRRQRKRSQRYSQDFVEADIDTNFDSDDDIMGEAVYDEEYLRSRKRHKARLLKEDEEFQLEQVTNHHNGNHHNDEEYPSSTSEDEKEPQRYKRLATCSPRETNFTSIDGFQIGITRSKRSTSTRPHIKYQQYDLSGTDTELGKPGKIKASDPDAGSDALHDIELSTTSQDQEEEDAEVNKERLNVLAPSRDNGSAGERVLDLNELAPIGGFEETQSRHGERRLPDNT